MQVRTRRGFVAAGLTVIVGGLATRAVAQSDATPGASPEASPSASPMATDATQITIENYRFVPPMIEIPVGTTLTWTNLDIIPHTATADDESFDSDILSRDDSFSFTFESAGEFSYYCFLHRTMLGSVTVV